MLTPYQTNIILIKLIKIASAFSNSNNNDIIPEHLSENIIVEQRITKQQMAAILKDILKLDIQTIFTDANGHQKNSIRFSKNTPEALGLKTHTVELVITQEDFYVVFMINSKLANGNKIEKPLSFSGRDKTYKPQICIKMSKNDTGSFCLMEIARKRASLTPKNIVDPSTQALQVKLKSIALDMEVNLQRLIPSDLISKPFMSSHFTKGKTDKALYIYDRNGIQSLLEFSNLIHIHNVLTYEKNIIHGLVLDMLNAVKIIHDLGIVHGDIKLDNFILHKDGDRLCAKLDDFGDAINYKSHLIIQSQFLQKLGFSQESFLENGYLLDISTMLFMLDLNFTAQQIEEPKRTLKLHEVRNKIHTILNSCPNLTTAQIKILSNIDFILQKGTNGYASPQIAALIMKQPNNCFVNNDYFNSSHGHLQYLKFKDTVTNQAKYIPNKKNDVYSLGICIFGLLHGCFPDGRGFTNKAISNSNFFSGMLNYNEAHRFTINEAIDAWKNEFSITSDNESAASPSSKPDLNGKNKKMRPS